ncbi:hypothetical protein JJB74_28965 [Noviherbaspirillum sp. DKR-6]|uniref:Uncharacterized protein n=1 Tax=Noviherbaspirillum pedocola TaxID=2801341 RepID=A0A934SZQ6_9BURK|nr:hypothetical protein [Noviherbaspirillum pedocola]MBK4738664.1 hypothetical protein [Noviherbaspirillum pedocola]
MAPCRLSPCRIRRVVLDVPSHVDAVGIDSRPFREPDGTVVAIAEEPDPFWIEADFDAIEVGLDFHERAIAAGHRELAGLTRGNLLAPFLADVEIAVRQTYDLLICHSRSVVQALLARVAVRAVSRMDRLDGDALAFEDVQVEANADNIADRRNHALAHDALARGIGRQGLRNGFVRNHGKGAALIERMVFRVQYGRAVTAGAFLREEGEQLTSSPP